MGNSQSAHKISAQDRAILDMKNQRDRLHQYQKKITIITNRESEIAKECLTRGDKSKALLALRRKKYQESLLSQTDAQLEQLEKLTNSVEFALVQKDVVYGLQRGTEVLKEIHHEMGGLEKIEKLMGDAADERAYQKEISEALAGQMSNQDEDEVEDELDALEKEVNKIQLPDAPNQGVIESPLPDAPTSNLGAEEEKSQRQKDRAKARRVALEA